jgi:hypothetical protein
VFISPSKVVATAVWRRGPFAAPWWLVEPAGADGAEAPYGVQKPWENDGKVMGNLGKWRIFTPMYCNFDAILDGENDEARGIGLTTSFNVGVHVKQNEA